MVDPPTSMSSRKENVMTARRKVADNELLIVRTFNAPPSVVFALWSSAEHIKRWMPQEFHLPGNGDRSTRRRPISRDDQVYRSRRELVWWRLSRDRAGQAVGVHLHVG